MCVNIRYQQDLLYYVQPIANGSFHYRYIINPIYL